MKCQKSVGWNAFCGTFNFFYVFIYFFAIVRWDETLDADVSPVCRADVSKHYFQVWVKHPHHVTVW